MLKKAVSLCLAFMLLTGLVTPINAETAAVNGVTSGMTYGTTGNLGTNYNTTYGTTGNIGTTYGTTYPLTNGTTVNPGLNYGMTYGTTVNPGTTFGTAGMSTPAPTATAFPSATMRPNATAAPYGTTNARLNTGLATATAAPFGNTRLGETGANAVSDTGTTTTGTGVTSGIFDYNVAADVAGTQYAEAAEVLKALSIMVGDAETGNFRPNDNIIRSEVAKVAVYTLGLQDVAGGSTQTSRFPDVPSTHWATGVINVSDTQRLVIGDENGNFRPDDNITFAEAVTIVVRALGFEPAAQANGGFPTGYMVIGAQQGVLKGVSGTADQPAKRGDVAQLVYNALTTNMMEQTGFGKDITYEVGTKTILTDRLDVTKERGQVTANYETRLTSPTSSLREDEVEINSTLYRVGTTRARNLLGYNVVYYSRLDTRTDENTLLLARPESNKNATITVSATNIQDVIFRDTPGTLGTSRITFSYWINKLTDRDPKKATVAATPTLIYNGMQEDFTALTQLWPSSGNVTLLDTNGTDEYNVIFVNQFRNIVVNDVSMTTGRITDKYVSGSVVLDPNDTAVKYAIIKNGVNIGLSDINEWDVLSVTESTDNTLIKVYVSTNSVTGTVNEISGDKYVINGVEYEVAESFIIRSTTPGEPYTLVEPIELQDKGTFYLDIEGKIAAVDKTAMVTANYAYLVDIGESSGFSPVAQLKVFDKTGATVIYNCATKIRLNGVYSVETTDVLADPALVSGGAAINQILTYELNSRGEISAIDTATASAAPVTSKFTINDTGTFTYKSASRKLGPATIDSNTIVFDVPSSAANDTALFAVRNASMFSNDSDYTGSIYDMTQDYVARAVMITSTTGIVAPEASIAVVDRITQTQNPEMTYVDKLYAYQGGALVEILASDRSVLVKGSTGATTALEQGDIIMYRTNARGEIDYVTTLFDIRTKDTETTTIPFGQSIPTDLTVAYGHITRKFAGSVNLSVDGAISNFATTGATVYEVDTTRTTGQVRVIDAGDLQVFEPGLNERRVFVKLYKDVPQEFVMIK